VIEADPGTERASRSLRHGSTMHGVQFEREPLRSEPTTYYGRITALGTVLSEREPGAATRIGVIGLGVGTLAAYGRAGDTLRFYEIDPNVVRIARESGWFSYLDDSEAEIEYAVGDARALLEEEQARGVTQDFDVLVVDAFSSDAVPVHLLTREAFATHASALAPEGLLAIHGSNRHFSLPILAARMGQEAGFDGLQVRTGEAPAYLSSTAKWVLLHRDPKRLRSIERSLEQAQQRRGGSAGALWIWHARPVELKHVPVWTDDYSDLFSLLFAR
jgi:spermidine synthase